MNTENIIREIRTICDHLDAVDTWLSESGNSFRRGLEVLLELFETSGTARELFLNSLDLNIDEYTALCMTDAYYYFKRLRKAMREEEKRDKSGPA